jgi:arylsulfatase A-like enzyme
LVSQVDLVPTIMSYAGLDPQAVPWIQGQSMRDMLEGRAPAYRDSVVVDYHSVAEACLVLKTLCTDNWKITMYADGRPGELTNLEQDPDEFHNLYGLPSHVPVQRELEHQLLVELIAQADTWPERIANA